MNGSVAMRSVGRLPQVLGGITGDQS